MSTTTEFKVGDLVVPTEKARKHLPFNKNVIFPWKVKRVHCGGIGLTLERYSKRAKPRTEGYAAAWWQLATNESNSVHFKN
jgi:hypothetical protein